jgi:DNA helicase-2/ATP-dependent DNA helicase PcrA
MDYNAQQQAAIECENQHILVLAGAGTGKTRTIIGRAAHLLRQGCTPERLVMITFTRRAAAEIRHRLTTEVGPACKHVVAGTFHNFCLREMSARRDWFGLTGTTIMDADDQSQMMKLVRGEIANSSGATAVPQASQLVSYYSYARNTNQPVRDYLEKFTDLGGDQIDLVLKIFAAYKQRKAAGGYLDFDDILHRFAQVMREDQEICRRIAKNYSHVLVDEMQDTNPLQWLILEALAPSLNLFCVGDDAQSIYAFRGADFRNVHSFNERLPGGQVLKLELNYRSTQEILDLSNWLLSRSPLKYGKQLVAHRGPGQVPEQIEFESDFDEAQWVVDCIVKRHKNGMRWDQQMVLCRTAYSARPIEAELIERNLPYRFIGGIGLLQMAHVKDLLSILRVAVNHHDELAWARYLTMWPRIGDSTAAKTVHFVRTATDSLAAIELLEQRLKRPEITKPIRLALKHRDDPAQAISGLSDLLEELLKSRYENWDTRSRDYKLIARLATKHQDLKTFLDSYTLDPISASEANSQEKEDIITLITVHSAKGAEAKVCHVVAAQPGNFPHSRSMGDPQAVEEERRVLYVAMTRAQDELVISSNFSRGVAQSSWRPQPIPINFFEGMPHKLVGAGSPSGRARTKRQSVPWDDGVIQ